MLWQGFTALDCAAANGHTEIVGILARLGGSHGSNTPDYYSVHRNLYCWERVDSLLCVGRE